jgi:hypothetical protein
VIKTLYDRGGAARRGAEGRVGVRLRHPFASQAIEYGTDVVEQRDILGLASLVSTAGGWTPATSVSAKLSPFTRHSPL